MRLEGQTLDIYTLGAELGRGGMGVVHKAEAVREGPAGPAGTVVAVKIFHPHLVAEGTALDRFRREAEVGRRIRHANVVRTFGAGEGTVDGEPCHFMVMEYVEGQTLEDLLQELGTVPDHLLYPIADQVLAGLQAIHDQGIVHRDLKPANVVITNTHKVLIMDLGVARMTTSGFTLTSEGQFVGSLHYAAPEQLLTDADIRPVADLYSLGVVLFELTAGTLPVDAPQLGVLLHRKATAEARRPSEVRSEVDPFLDEVIYTCLEREPSARFASAEALQQILSEGTSSTWWQHRAGSRQTAGAERALQRLRLERQVPRVGRQREMRRLRDLFAATRTEREGLVFVAGPGGVGKSRLVYDFLEGITSTSGPQVGAGRAAGRGGRSYQAFLEVGRDLLGVDDESGGADRRRALAEDLGAMLRDRPGVVEPFLSLLLGDAGESASLSKDAVFATFEAVLEQLAEKRPLVLVLEDLHLAGEDTLDLLTYLARNLAKQRVLLVGVYDDEQMEAGGELDRLVTRVEGEREGSRIRVGPLDRQECDQLLRSVVGHERTVHSLSDLLHRRSDGNPLIILEVVAQLKSAGTLAEQDGGFVLGGDVAVFELPRKATELVHYKLAGLDDELRETLDAAAVLGREFRASVLAAMLEEKRIRLLKRLAVLERTHRLIQGSGKDTFRFSQAPGRGDPVPRDPRGPARASTTRWPRTRWSRRPKRRRCPRPSPSKWCGTSCRPTGRTRSPPTPSPPGRYAVSNHHATYARAFLDRVAEAVGDADPQTLCDVQAPPVGLLRGPGSAGRTGGGPGGGPRPREGGGRRRSRRPGLLPARGHALAHRRPARRDREGRGGPRARPRGRKPRVGGERPPPPRGDRTTPAGTSGSATNGGARPSASAARSETATARRGASRPSPS